ncbi:pyridoxal kinase PdxY [Hwanghaeella sp.]|uniref:pyridoxal kinase PdxY n=1 Tax=Hwanghaeella sp. TaxID=2605943 RepID=UPI003CCB75FD
MNVISIQSHVSFGHVGNSAAVFPFQRHGLTVWPVHTVLFSNHTGYDGWRGPVLSPETVREVLQGMEERGIFVECDGVLTGYVGNPGLGSVVADLVGRVRQANPKAIYCCDPVMGDEGRGFYVSDGVAGFMQDTALPLADVLTPNKFELQAMSPFDGDSLPDLIGAARRLCAKGPRLVLVTSLERADGPPDAVEMLLVSKDCAWLAETPRLSFPINPNGAGDMTAALFMAATLKGRDPGSALGDTISAVYAVLEKTRDLGRREMALVEAQNAIVSPQRRFEAREIAG